MYSFGRLFLDFTTNPLMFLFFRTMSNCFCCFLFSNVIFLTIYSLTNSFIIHFYKSALKECIKLKTLTSVIENIYLLFRLRGRCDRRAFKLLLYFKLLQCFSFTKTCFESFNFLYRARRIKVLNFSLNVYECTHNFQ